MKNAIVAGLTVFVLGCALQHFWIIVQRRLKVTQVQKSYGIGIDVEIKASTPHMGGVVFVFLAVSVLLVQHSFEALLFWSLPIACGAIGFVDDRLKFVSRSSEGFSSMGKLKIQVVVSAVWVIWALLQRGLVLWPGLQCPFWLSVPLTVLATVGMMNAVNVTDGLDGLAGGAFIISLGVLRPLLPSSDFGFSFFAVLFAMVAAFLLFNVRPARTFMGDTGSHFLGGALVAVSVQGDMILALIPAGFLFGFELISSALQIVSIRKFNRKIFRMAPLHHHFQSLGWDETTVTMRFLTAHAAGAALLAGLLVLILN